MHLLFFNFLPSEIETWNIFYISLLLINYFNDSPFKDMANRGDQNTAATLANKTSFLWAPTRRSSESSWLAAFTSTPSSSSPAPAERCQSSERWTEASGNRFGPTAPSLTSTGGPILRWTHSSLDTNAERRQHLTLLRLN
jgi:hypothetical protein